MRGALDRRLALLHRLEERRLGLRRSTVDLVREEEVGEDRPRPELEVTVALVPDRRAGDVRGHEVGGELDAREAHAQDLGEGPGRERLRQAGVVLEQDVPVREESEQHELERLALSDDRLLDLVEDVARELPGPVRAPCLCALQRVDDLGELRGAIPRAAGPPVRAGRDGRAPTSLSPRIACAVEGFASSETRRREASSPAAIDRSRGTSR